MGESNASLCTPCSGNSFAGGASTEGDSSATGDGTYHERTGTILEKTTSFLTANYTGLSSSFTATSLA